MRSTFVFRACSPCKLKAAIVGVAVIALVGCGPKRPAMAPVKGKVMLNGQLMNIGSVGTVPAAGRGAHGDIRPDGTFELHTYSAGDGALIGKHKVAVVAYDATGGKTPESEYGKLMVPKRYANYETSGLTIDVNPNEPNTPTIELTSP
jgi:hypothetical protein